MFWGVCARVTAGVFGHWLIGHLAHNHGELVREIRGAAVQGRNVRFASLLTMGECWHNNHHAFPDFGPPRSRSGRVGSGLVGAAGIATRGSGVGNPAAGG